VRPLANVDESLALGTSFDSREDSSRLAMTDNSPFSQLVTFMTAQDGMAAILITLHSDDGTGHCRQCTSGAQAGRHVWPCQTYLAACKAAGTTQSA
jgi:hypothetical protein